MMANFITFLRFFLTFPTLYTVLEESKHLSFTFILVGALSDFLDGSLARKKGKDQGLGVLLDPMVDKVFVLSTLSAFLYLQKIHPLPFVLLLTRELLTSFLRSLAVEKGYLMQASYLGKIKTFFEFLSLLGISLGLSFGSWALWIAVVLSYLSLYDYFLKYLSFGGDKDV